MARKQQQKPGSPAREAEGVVWVASTGVTWKETPITVEKLKKFAEGPYGDGATQKQRNLIFTGPARHKVVDEKGEEDPELTAWITAMAQEPDVAAYYRMQQEWHSTFWYGPGLVSPTLAQVENEWRLTELRHLDPGTFSKAPEGDFRATCALLPGIVQTKEGEIQYWQVQEEGEEPKRITNILAMQDPIRPELGSRPTILSIVSVFAMLDYLWAAQMQKCHRVGSPLLFVRIRGARTKEQLGGKVKGDVEYAKEFLKNWGKNTGFVLRDNMELIDPHVVDNADNLETIEALDRMITNHFSPAAYISKDGQTIGGSAAPEKELLANYTRGIQAWIEAFFARIFMLVLEANELQGYSVIVELPDLQFDERELEMKIAESSFKTESSQLNERRRLYHLEPLDEEGEAALKAEYAARASLAAPVPVAVGNVGRAKAPAKIVDTTEAELEAITTRARKKVLAALEAEGIA